MVIFFVGFVFSPDYAAARREVRRGGSGDIEPRSYCAVNAALYRRNRREQWVCNEYTGTTSPPSPSALAIGRSHFRRDVGDGSYQIHLDEPLTSFGGLRRNPPKLTGDIHVAPRSPSSPIVSLTERSPTSGRHQWQALAPLSDVEVRCGATTFRGIGYLDSNRGERPLEADFRRWSWCRVSGRERAEVVYDYELRDGRRRAVIMAADPHHATTSDAFAVRTVRRRRSLWGVGLDSTEVVDDGPAPHTRQVTPYKVIDDSPFYARYLAQVAPSDGHPMVGIGESLDLSRFDNRIVQRMLSYRIAARTTAGAGPLVGGGP